MPKILRSHSLWAISCTCGKSQQISRIFFSALWWTQKRSSCFVLQGSPRMELSGNRRWRAFTAPTPTSDLATRGRKNVPYLRIETYFLCQLFQTILIFKVTSKLFPHKTTSWNEDSWNTFNSSNEGFLRGTSEASSITGIGQKLKLGIGDVNAHLWIHQTEKLQTFGWFCDVQVVVLLLYKKNSRAFFWVGFRKFCKQFLGYAVVWYYMIMHGCAWWLNSIFVFLFHGFWVFSVFSMLT